ncbi:cytochrome-c oxidase, cbb3-type subunit II [Helicobacter ailurogastricus]|uniref:cytochrome-c oxidase, cbb3-type subunit II n=1 Tax=Helicobacter ailurogastricus TaxID=1578720 RepID=UPI0022C4E2E3|nr:cytochrome-c oxidase, cbb3-type subunit II [Helicobacter ailurogastricus]GLH57437.1 Cbb3-type cytochrome c oxidase subunit II FixO [Helicobacter ailurogastricus]GLH58809.1 Cbb3-type cytochrome c oxidase subunit II FixO [Helicobacter ailurogastricus]GMB91191.1 Cbb3-type cytochrome c oxidase subunit II FixO [Helicobacter ailurogastricus]
MFYFLEKNPFFFTLAFVVAFAVAGVVEILPNFFKSARPIEGLKPYSILETAGRQVYIQEGCYNCHSQLIRPFQAEVQRYGAYSLSGEYAYDRPFLWGSRRIGPDLHRVGDVRTTAWHEKHMLEPTSVVPGSIMPAYKHLFKKDADFDTAFAEAYTQKEVFKVPYDKPGGVQLGDMQEAKKLFLEEAKGIVERMQDPEVKAALKEGRVKEIVALIAYLNSLGQGRIEKPSAKGQ